MRPLESHIRKGGENAKDMTRKNPQEMSMRKSLVFQYRNDSVEQKGRKQTAMK